MCDLSNGDIDANLNVVISVVFRPHRTHSIDASYSYSCLDVASLAWFVCLCAGLSPCLTIQIEMPFGGRIALAKGTIIRQDTHGRHLANTIEHSDAGCRC